MGKLKEKLQKFMDNPDVAFKEQMGYVSGVFGNCMGQDSVSTYTDQFMYDYMGLKSSHMVAMKSTTTAVNILIAPIILITPISPNDSNYLYKKEGGISTTFHLFNRCLTPLNPKNQR